MDITHTDGLVLIRCKIGVDTFLIEDGEKFTTILLSPSQYQEVIDKLQTARTVARKAGYNC